MTDWWALSLKARLSQGDLVSLVPVSAPAVPERSLTRSSTQKGGQNTWVESSAWQADADGLSHLLARGRKLHALVLSHDCELDKPGAKRVLVAPVLPITNVAEQDREPILQQRRVAFIPLTDVPEFGVSYVDLRCICFLDRKIVDSATRQRSMSKVGVARIWAQLTAFFSYRELEQRMP